MGTPAWLTSLPFSRQCSILTEEDKTTVPYVNSLIPEQRRATKEHERYETDSLSAELVLPFPSPLLPGHDARQLRDECPDHEHYTLRASCPNSAFTRSTCSLSDRATAARRRPDDLQPWQCRGATLL